LAYVHEEEKPD